jgi:hypothetical protein
MPKMANVPIPGYQKLWADKRTTLKAEYQSLVAKYPDAGAQLLVKQLFKILCDVEAVAGHTPVSVGESVEWTSIVSTAEGCSTSTAKLSLESPFLCLLWHVYFYTHGVRGRAQGEHPSTPN